MVVDRKPTAESLGRVFAKAVRGDDAVREIWVTEDQDGFIISVFTDEIDADHERKIYARSLDVHEKFPEALFEVHVRNPANYSFESFGEMRDTLLPPGARKAQLQP
jgi:hypothetical protein